MLHIVLTVLAVIGKILLGILGLILLLLLLILFVPIRYKGSFQKQEKSIQAEASVSWLLHLVSLKISWIEKQLSWELRLFGIPLKPLLNRIRNRKNSSEEKEQRPDPEDKQENEGEGPGTQEPGAELHESDGERTAAQGEGTGQPDESAEIHEADGIFSRLKKIFGGLVKLPERIQKTWNTFADRMKALFSRAESLADRGKKLLKFLQSKLFREVLELVKKEVFAILRHIAPRKISGRVNYGTGDPGSTGEILAALAAVYPIFPKDLSVEPDFEEAVLDCDLAVKGRIQTAVLIFHGGKLILNKNVRRLIRKVRHQET